MDLYEKLVSTHDELNRLGCLLVAAVANPYSCPRDRAILQTKITDLREEADSLSIRRAEVAATSDAVLDVVINKLRTWVDHATNDLQPDGAQEAEDTFDNVSMDDDYVHLLIWEYEQQSL